MNVYQDLMQKLLDAKTRRIAAVTACAEAAIAADNDEHAHDAAISRLADIQEIHDAHIASGAAAKSAGEFEQAMALTVAAKTEMLCAVIVRDMAKIKADSSRSNHVAAIAELRASETAVADEARDVLNAELVTMAVDFERALDDALTIGRKLQSLADTNELHQPLNMPVRTLPQEVETALARMPKPDELHVPIATLLGLGARSNEFEMRLKALAA